MARFEGEELRENNSIVVTFYKGAIRNNLKCEEEGREIWDDVVFIKKYVPGMAQFNVVDRPIYPSDKVEFPHQWAVFEATEGGEAKQSGTPIDEWPRLKRGQIEQLKALKFYTIESIAGASDTQLQALGMAAGTSPPAFRDAAKRFLLLASDDAHAAKETEKIETLNKENAEIRAQLNEMRKMLSQLTAPNVETIKTAKK